MRTKRPPPPVCRRRGLGGGGKGPLATALLVSLWTTSAFARQTVTIGSKKFTESYVLGEIVKKKLEDAGFRVEHKQGMGGTIILWSALKSAQIQMYPDYTGTIVEEILKRKDRPSEKEIRNELARSDIGMTESLGFEDKYALVIRREEASRLRVKKISDLRAHPDLLVGVTPEFFDRQDGWKALAAKYGLKAKVVKTIEHALGYQALLSGQVSIKDAYTTDAKLADERLMLLEDDLHFFPPYHAVFLYRLNTPKKAVEAFRTLEGTIDEALMTRLNAEAEESKDYSQAAQTYFREVEKRIVEIKSESLEAKIARWTLRHLQLAGTSLLLAVLVGIPLGVVASGRGLLGQIILGFANVVQTIPSLALLALLVPLPFFGIGIQTAIAALFLYSLLPIVRNTATGLQNVPIPIRESAAAMGLEPGARLVKVFLPIASPSILAGISTSAVINVGTATLAALIGAGGLGEPIISGLNLNDTTTILHGAIPAAILAILVQVLFEGLEKVIVPRGLRLKPASK
jgi:osmoprotectant transport system permease protein